MPQTANRVCSWIKGRQSGVLTAPFPTMLLASIQAKGRAYGELELSRPQARRRHKSSKQSRNSERVHPWAQTPTSGTQSRPRRAIIGAREAPCAKTALADKDRAGLATPASGAPQPGFFLGQRHKNSSAGWASVALAWQAGESSERSLDLLRRRTWRDDTRRRGIRCPSNLSKNSCSAHAERRMPSRAEIETCR